MLALTRRNILDYLLERGLVSPESVVDGDYMVASASSRNRNFKVFRAPHRGYFVKQVERRSQEAMASLAREAAVYQLAASQPAFRPVAELAPALVDYDPQAQVLVVELFPQGETLTWARWREKVMPVSLSAGLGRMLGAFHAIAITAVDPSLLPRFGGQPPWILSLHEHGAQSYGPDVSAANRQLIDILRRYPDFPKLLEALRAGWRRDSLIHGDLKWENCVVVDPAAAEPVLKLIDWELADLGDAAWDVGAILQAFLSDWVFSMTAAPGARPADLEESAQSPLEDSRDSIHAFWNAYLAERRLHAGAAEELLDRAVRYAAARMLQTAYEYSHPKTQLDAHDICLLQLSLNVLRDPARAIVDLFHLKEAASHVVA